MRAVAQYQLVIPEQRDHEGHPGRRVRRIHPRHGVVGPELQQNLRGGRKHRAAEHHVHRFAGASGGLLRNSGNGTGHGGWCVFRIASVCRSNGPAVAVTMKEVDRTKAVVADKVSEPGAQSEAGSTGARTAEPPRGFIAEWTVTIILLLFGTTTLVQAFVIPTGSMEDTLLVGDHLLVDKLAFAPGGSITAHLLPYED